MRSRMLLLAAVLGLACNGESPTEPRPGDAPPQAVFQGYTIDPQGNYRIDFVNGSTKTLTRASGLCTCSYDFLLKRR